MKVLKTTNLGNIRPLLQMFSYLYDALFPSLLKIDFYVCVPHQTLPCVCKSDISEFSNTKCDLDVDLNFIYKSETRALTCTMHHLLESVLSDRSALWAVTDCPALILAPAIFKGKMISLHDEHSLKSTFRCKQLHFFLFAAEL